MASIATSTAEPCAAFWATTATARISGGRPTRSPKAVTRNSRSGSAPRQVWAGVGRWFTQRVTVRVMVGLPDDLVKFVRYGKPAAAVRQLRRSRLFWTVPGREHGPIRRRDGGQAGSLSGPP